MCVWITVDYPKPSAFLCDFINSVAAHTSERFIYSCKSYFKWLTSKRLVYRAKWRAASPFKAASVFIFPSKWAAEWGEFNLYENASTLQAHSPVARSFRRFPSSFHSPFSSSSILQPLKGKALDCSCNDSVLERTFRSLITHKCMLTTAWQSTWKCLLQASAQLHKTSSAVRKSLF